MNVSITAKAEGENLFRSSILMMMTIMMIIMHKEYAGWVFFIGPTQKVLSMELVPPNSDNMTKFSEKSTIPTKKVKVQIRACQIFISLC